MFARSGFGIALLAAGATGCAPHAEAARPVAVPVALATAAAVRAQPRYAGPGTVAPQHVYRVGFEVAGRVAVVPHDVGDRVEAGSLLAALDPSDASAQVRAARARADEAAAAAQKAGAGSRAAERLSAGDGEAAARAALERAQAAEALARTNAARYDDLFASGDVSAMSRDQTRTAERDAMAAVRAARAALEQAHAQRALVDEGPRGEDRRAASAAASAAAASADSAALALAHTRLVAPADVRILERDVEPGTIAAPGSVAFVLTDARTPDVVVAVPAARLAGIRPGTTATISDGTHRWNGTVVRLEPLADVTTRTAKVRVRAAGLALPGGSVVDVALGSQRAAAQGRIPLGALTGGDGASREVAVYDASRGTTVRRLVRVVALDGDDALVDGIAPGTPVVRTGASLVRPGAPVRVVADAGAR